MRRALGHEVEAAASGEEALPLLSSESFDVLFTDVSLPGMSGVELARQSRRTRPDLELLFASGYGDELTRHLEFPARSLQKPYDIDLLQIALEQIAIDVQAKAASEGLASLTPQQFREIGRASCRERV